MEQGGQEIYSSRGIILKMIFKGFRKYLFIYFLFVKNSIMSQMEYRINFIFCIFMEIAFLCIKLLYVLVVYGLGFEVNGINAESMLLFVGTFSIMTGIYCSLFYVNFTSLAEHIRTGSLDLMMIKPISLQFLSTLRFIDIGMPIPNIGGGLIMVIIGWHRLNLPVTPYYIFGFAFFIIIGTLLTYAIFILPQLLSFWTIKTNGINEVSNGLWDFNNVPMLLLNKYIRRFGTFIIPVFLVTNLSPLFILGRLDYFYILWEIIATVVFLTIAKLVWNFAIRNYTSANG